MHALLSLVISSVTFIFTFLFSYADKLKMPSSIFIFYLCICFQGITHFMLHKNMLIWRLGFLFLFILQISIKPNLSVSLLG